MLTYEYKNSGIEWIGEIPKHWKNKRITDIAAIFGRIGFRGYTTQDLVQEGEGAITISPSNINENKMDFSNCTFISWEKYFESPEIMIFENDIIMVKTGSSYGKVGLIKDLSEKATINPQLVVFKNINSDRIFLLYLLKSFNVQNQILSSVLGSTIPTLTQSNLSRIRLSLPPKPEQTAIAAYLDKACANIDRVVEIKRKQISNLQQQLKSIIHHTVTKGLDKNAELKESGIEWIGKVPKHWKVKMLKWFFQLSRGYDLPTEKFIEGEIPVMGSNGCIGYHNTYSTKGPGITVGRSGSVGAVNFVHSDFWAHNTCLFIEHNFYNDWRFLLYFLSCFDLKSLGSGSVVGTLNRNYIHKEIVAFPKISEQTEIANYLEEMTYKIKTAQSKIEKQIETLILYKKSLIHEVVTGKKQVWNGN